jgi:hypothetical protein
LGSTADVVAKVVNTPQIAAELAAKGGTAAYVAEPDLTTSAPVLVVMAEDRLAAVAERTAVLVVAQIQRTLEEQQEAAAAPRGTWVSARVLVTDEPRRLWKSQVRLAIAAFAAVAMLALAFIFALEAARRRRAAPEPSQHADIRDASRRRASVEGRPRSLQATAPDDDVLEDFSAGRIP